MQFSLIKKQQLPHLPVVKMVFSSCVSLLLRSVANCQVKAAAYQGIPNVGVELMWGQRTPLGLHAFVWARRVGPSTKLDGTDKCNKGLLNLVINSSFIELGRPGHIRFPASSTWFGGSYALPPRHQNTRKRIRSCALRIEALMRTNCGAEPCKMMVFSNRATVGTTARKTNPRSFGGYLNPQTGVWKPFELTSNVLGQLEIANGDSGAARV